MIASYQIRRLSNEEECLVLYIRIQEEFSLEWFDELKENGFKDFIEKHKIFWNGTKVFLVVGGITLAVLNYNPTLTIENNYDYVTKSLVSNLVSEVEVQSNKIDPGIEDVVEQEEKVFNNSFINSSNIDETVNSYIPDTPKIEEQPIVPNVTPSVLPEDVVEMPEVEEVLEIEPFFVTIHRGNGSIINLSMEDYLIGVVAAEMPASFHIEALKAQSILARTYAMKAIDSGKILTDTVSTQRYIDKDEMEKLWGSSYSKYYEKIKQAVRETQDLVVTYQNSLIDAVYHSTSNGRTEDSENVWGNYFPYLKSVSSLFDKEASSYFKEMEITKKEFLNIFNISDSDYSLEILSRNKTGRVSFVRIGNKTYSGIEVRELLGLRSTDFDIFLNEDTVNISTRGYGHGVGMSQYGANGMAKEGMNYKDIINHYYTGVEIVTLL